MTLEEAIKHCEEVAESCERGNPKKRSKSKCASEHRQLAEWLKELKESRIILDILGQFLVDIDSDVCCDDLMDNEEEQKICEKYCTFKTKGCWVRWAKMKAREVNADESNN